jgi:trehalose 6-phosphate phosphatase
LRPTLNSRSAQGLAFSRVGRDSSGEPQNSASAAGSAAVTRAARGCAGPLRPQEPDHDVKPPRASNLPPPVNADARGWALFLDVDGSLVEYADSPDSVALARETVILLDELHRLLDGAVAILSGRRLVDIDRMTAPLILAASGLHGVERRRGDGTVLRRVPDAQAQACMRARCVELARRHPRAVVEDKGSCIALHFRAAPELEPALRDGAAWVVEGCSGKYEVQPGVRVFELKPVGSDKGSALADFLREPPFAGRVPVAVGDDHTDEHAFEAAHAAGGFGVCVGSRVSHGASYVLREPSAVRAWLAELRAAMTAIPA